MSQPNPPAHQTSQSCGATKQSSLHTHFKTKNVALTFFRLKSNKHVVNKYIQKQRTTTYTTEIHFFNFDGNYCADLVISPNFCERYRLLPLLQPNVPLRNRWRHELRLWECGPNPYMVCRRVGASH
jgi:hypothetical protein